MIEQKVDWNKPEFPAPQPISSEIMQQLKTIGDFNINSKLIFDSNESKQIYTLEFLHEIPTKDIPKLMTKVQKILHARKMTFTYKGAETSKTVIVKVKYF